MGTRGSCGILYQGEVKLGYNQFDSYPGGLGLKIITIITRINKENGWQKLRENISKVKNVEEEDITPEIIERYSHYADLGVSEQKYEDPYCLFRKIQDIWINEVYEGNIEHYNINNSLHEFCYLINLDDNVLEFYVGWGNGKQNNRFRDQDCTLCDVVPLKNINMKYVERMEKYSDEDKINPRVEIYLKNRERKSKLEYLEKNNIN